MEGLRSRQMRKSVRAEKRIKVEIEEEFCAVMENIKSEVTETFHVTDCQVVPLSSRCRLCTIPNNDMVDIFNSNESGKHIFDMIKHCLPIVIRETDTLPKRVCRLCLEKLDLCFQFQKTVVDAEKQLLALDIQARVKLDGTEGNPSKNVECNDIEKTLKTSSNTTLEVKDTNKLNKINRKGSGVPRTTRTRLQTRKKAISDTHCGDKFENQEDLAVPEGAHIEGTHASVTMTATEDSRNRITELDTRKGIDKPEYRGRKLTIRGEENHRYQSSEKSYKCRICQKTFNAFKKLKRHKRVHSENGIYRCSICDGLLQSERSLLRHMLIHKQRTLKCQHCNKYDSSKYSLNQHRISEICENPDCSSRLFKCIFCGKPFRSKIGLYLHIKIHTGEGLYTCEYCGKKFPTKARKVAHHSAVHATERPFECSICKKTFGLPSHLKRHESLHN